MLLFASDSRPKKFHSAKIIKMYTKCQHWRRRMFSFNFLGAGYVIPNAKSYLELKVTYNLSRYKEKKCFNIVNVEDFYDLVLKWTVHHSWHVIICDRAELSDLISRKAWRCEQNVNVDAKLCSFQSYLFWGLIPYLKFRLNLCICGYFTNVRPWNNRSI